MTKLESLTLRRFAEIYCELVKFYVTDRVNVILTSTHQ